MKKEQFLDALAEELRRLGADDAAITAHKAKMDALLRSKNVDDVDIDPRRMAEGIMQKLSEERQKKAAGTPAGTAEDPLSALPDKPKREAPAPRNDSRKNTRPGRSTDTAPIPAPARTERKGNAASDPVTDPDYYEKSAPKKKTADEGENKTLFWVLFCAAVPLGAILCAVAVVLFLGLILLLLAAAVGFVAALIVIVGVGCSIALIGIIYGAYKIVTGVVPIGLYEIGLGITVGSVASLIGILMYNIAIRLVPFLMKKLTELVGFGLRKARDGFAALKGALENQ